MRVELAALWKLHRRSLGELTGRGQSDRCHGPGRGRRASQRRSIQSILDSPHRRFVLFGDTNHRDPEVYRAVIDAFGDRVIAVFIHDVEPIDPERLEELTLFQHYGQVAGTLFELGLLDEGEARRAMVEVATSGQDDFGLEDVEPLLDAHRPGAQDE